MVAAVAENGVIGDGPDIPWHLPGEQRLFKEATVGHVLVLGRTTHESIGRPLPGRTTVVLTRQVDWSADGVHVAADLAAALALADELVGGTTAEVRIGGGAQVYAAAMPYADEQLLTRVPLSPPGDVHYPAYDEVDWVETDRTAYDGFTQVRLVRRR
ncbi:dihydrofolate reductase [Nocardioidaceae bacterium]|nr:dihydrofolate reductase [Nocardioidaceae bacterium]